MEYNDFQSETLAFDMAVMPATSGYPTTGFYMRIRNNYHAGAATLAAAQQRILDGRLHHRAHFATVTSLLASTIPTDCHTSPCTVPGDAIIGLTPPLQVGCEVSGCTPGLPRLTDTMDAA